MKIVNIANKDRVLHLFLRDDKGQLRLKTIEDFYPFFYEPDEAGEFTAYDGTKLKKVIVEKPNDVREMRSDKSYASDIIYTKNYISQMIDKFDKCPIKYFFLDIEILTVDLPDVKTAKAPISCVTIYNSQKKDYISFYLGDYQGKSIAEKENKLIADMINYFQSEKPDLWLSWNVDFDYQYLHNRVKDFAKKISPINLVRASRTEDVMYPAGISVLDYLSMFKKVNLREGSYALDAICEKHLGYGKKHKTVDFSQLTPELKERNREDVELMVALEKKFKIMEYFDEIRRFSHCLWEDLTHNSLIIDSIILREAKIRNVILPRKPEREEDEDAEELEGAYRRSESGLFFDIYKADVGSMYPNQLVNFCLDPANVGTKEAHFDEKKYIEINGTWFKQDDTAMLPYLAKQLMSIKDELKKELKATKDDSDEKKIIQMKYDAYKGLVNSLYGVLGFSGFRMYDNRVASAITFLSRDLLHYVEDSMKGRGHEVIYTDTDSLFYKSDIDEIKVLNDLVQMWGVKYSKTKLDIRFETEGMFTKLLIVGKCHYYGYIKGKAKPEIKGMEMKRSSSSKYEGKFQEQLIEKVLARQSREDVLKWVENEKMLVRSLPVEEVSFPCKLQDKKYKNEPIFVRAYRNTKELLSGFHLSFGEAFFYVYVHPMSKSDKLGKPINVLAFTKDKKDHITNDMVDYKEIIRRNIDSKTDGIFEAVGWGNKKQTIATLF